MKSKRKGTIISMASKTTTETTDTKAEEKIWKKPQLHDSSSCSGIAAVPCVSRARENS
jgi:hypothetical protein